MQYLVNFILPKDFRGRSNLTVQLWWFLLSSFFALFPQLAYLWRIFLLRLFGAKIEYGCHIYPNV
jgi:putative colanic acid biosynthesis acetyltransferase WcaF